MTGGVATALGEVLDGQDAPEDLVQIGLFDELGPEEIGATDVPSPLSEALATPASRRGRPPGSRNRRTEAVVAWLLSQHRHPLSVMMEAYSMSPAELAAKAGLKDVDLFEVLKLQLRMAEAVAPYVAQKLPQAVQIDAKAGVTLAFAGVSLPARAAGSEIPEAGLGLRLPFKSDEGSRTGGQAPEDIEETA